MPLPELSPCLVVRHEYLWHRHIDRKRAATQLRDRRRWRRSVHGGKGSRRACPAHRPEDGCGNPALRWKC